MVVKKISSVLIFPFLLLCTNVCAVSKGVNLDSIARNVKTVGKTVKTVGKITKYGSAIAGAVYGIKAYKAAAKSVNVLIPKKLFDIAKIPINLFGKAPCCLLNFALYAIASSCFFSIAHSMHKIGF